MKFRNVKFPERKANSKQKYVFLKDVCLRVSRAFINIIFKIPINGGMNGICYLYRYVMKKLKIYF